MHRQIEQFDVTAPVVLSALLLIGAKPQGVQVVCLSFSLERK